MTDDDKACIMSVLDPKNLRPDEQLIFEYAQKEASAFVRLLIMTLLVRLRGSANTTMSKVKEPPVA